jgi:hypothetical protein
VTPAQAADVLDLWAAKATNNDNRIACRMGAAALRGPALADLRAMIQGSRVSLTLLEDDPELGPWAASIDYRVEGKPYSLAEVGSTFGEALTLLRDAIARRNAKVEKKAADIEYERVEREGIQNGPEKPA